MEFAEIPLAVPDYFPDLIVSSYLRDKGSHADHQAFDAVLKDVPYGREPGSLYWFFYLGIVDLLWRSQRRGVLRVAMPPHCPHYHFGFNTKKNLAGVELFSAPSRRIKDCTDRFMSAQNYDNKSIKRLRWIENFWKEVDPWMPGFLDRIQAEAKYLTTSNSKYIKVFTNNYIGLDDLESKIEFMFGDGSLIQKATDTVAQVVGYENATDAKEKLVTENPYVLVPVGAAILFAGYMIASRINPPESNYRPRRT